MVPWSSSQLLLFGGRNEFGRSLADTWLFDVNRWVACVTKINIGNSRKCSFPAGVSSLSWALCNILGHGSAHHSGRNELGNSIYSAISGNNSAVQTSSRVRHGNRSEAALAPQGIVPSPMISRREQDIGI